MPRVTGLLERFGLFARAPDMRPRAAIEADIREELAAHVALRAQDNEAAGMSPEEALRDAELRFGDTRRVAAACREIQMKERIVLQRINVILIVVLIAGTAANLWAGAGARADLNRDLAGLRVDVAALAGEVRATRAPAPPQLLTAKDLLAPLEVAETRRVYVLGQVSAPGAVVWRKDLTLSMALAECGGLAKHAGAERISVVHEGGGIDVHDLRILQIGTQGLADRYADRADKADPTTMEDPLLRPGDRIIVPESFL